MTRYTKEECKLIVDTFYKNKKKFKKTIAELRQIWTESELPSRYKLQSLIREYEKVGCGSPKKKKFQKKVEAVRDKLTENPHLTNAQLQRELGIPKSTLLRVIKSDVEINKLKKERKSAVGLKKKSRPKEEIQVDKNAVIEELYNAFDKHPYYTTSNLVKITKQRIGNLKMILREVCDFHVREPHKNMWELKRRNDYCNSEDDVDDSDRSFESDTYETLYAVDCILSEETMVSQYNLKV